MADQKPLLKVQSSPGSPGISGAIKDAIGALSSAFAPRGIVQRPKKVEQGIAEGEGQTSSPQTNQLGDQF